MDPRILAAYGLQLRLESSQLFVCHLHVREAPKVSGVGEQGQQGAGWCCHRAITWQEGLQANLRSSVVGRKQPSPMERRSASTRNCYRLCPVASVYQPAEREHQPSGPACCMTTCKDNSNVNTNKPTP